MLEKKKKKTAESSLRLRQIAGKGIVGSRRWRQRGSDRWWVGWGGCVCRWMLGPGAGCRGMFVSVLGTSIYLCLEQSQLCCLDTPSSSSILRFQPPPQHMISEGLPPTSTSTHPPTSMGLLGHRHFLERYLIFWVHFLPPDCDWPALHHRYKHHTRLPGSCGSL